LIGFEHIVPVTRAAEVLLVVSCIAEFAGEKSDDKVVVGVFYSPRDRASLCTHAFDVEILGRDVA
jgi:hypothetical protein